jgi:hypothetical protein
MERNMPRKLIVAVIGGNGLPEIAPYAHRLGELLSGRAILLTGGRPDDRPNENVKSAALAGSSNGLMISVLPGGNPDCKLQGRRLILQTGLEGKYARNPIVGSAGDIVVAFAGGAGTLVELAYAAFQNQPIIFNSSINHLRVKCSLEAKDLKKGLDEAQSAYSLIPAKQGDLENALAACLGNPKAVCVDTPEEVIERVFGFSKEPVAVQRETNFLGLPGGERERWKEKFNKDVAELSKP